MKYDSISVNVKLTAGYEGIWTQFPVSYLMISARTQGAVWEGLCGWLGKEKALCRNLLI